MSSTAVIVWRTVALILFGIVMAGVWKGADWFVNAIPPMMLALFVGGAVGLCAGVFIGGHFARTRENRPSTELRR